MTHEEAKRAFYHKIPVEYAGTQYLYIQALRYCWQRNGEGSGPLMQLELLDPKGNSVVVIPPKKAHLAGKLPGGEPPADGETLYEWQGIRMVKSGPTFPSRYQMPKLHYRKSTLLKEASSELRQVRSSAKWKWLR